MYAFANDGLRKLSPSYGSSTCFPSLKKHGGIANPGLRRRAAPSGLRWLTRLLVDEQLDQELTCYFVMN